MYVARGVQQALGYRQEKETWSDRKRQSEIRGTKKKSFERESGKVVQNDGAAHTFTFVIFDTPLVSIAST